MNSTLRLGSSPYLQILDLAGGEGRRSSLFRRGVGDGFSAPSADPEIIPQRNGKSFSLLSHLHLTLMSASDFDTNWGFASPNDCRFLHFYSRQKNGPIRQPRNDSEFRTFTAADFVRDFQYFLAFFTSLP